MFGRLEPLHLVIGVQGECQVGGALGFVLSRRPCEHDGRFAQLLFVAQVLQLPCRRATSALRATERSTSVSRVASVSLMWSALDVGSGSWRWRWSWQ